MATTATTMSGAQFDALPYEEGRKWELLRGDLVDVPSPTAWHQELVFRIHLALRQHMGKSGLAFSDVEFALTDQDRLRPDICVLLADRAKHLKLDLTPIPGAPDIAVEVISPGERSGETHEKVRSYLRNGASEVWQVFPKSRTIQIHKGGTARLLQPGENLTTDLLPGFALPLANLFDDQDMI